MPTGPQGEKRPAGVMREATREAEVMASTAQLHTAP